jgi:glycine cleavage system H protein
MKIPENLKYTDHDEWVRIEGDKIVVGITDFAQDQLGELVHVELPAVGKKVEAGKVVCEVESVKAVAEIYAPASGEVTAVNAALGDGAEQINSDPYGSWIYELKVSAPPQGLMDAAQYKAKIGS